MTMNCLHEHRIEQYVVGALQLTDDELSHLLSCDRCRAQYTFLHDLHQKMDTPIRKKGKKIGERWKVFHPISHEQESSDYSYRLAAQSQRSTPKHVITRFSNPEENMIGRVFMDKATGEVAVHLVAEQREKISAQRVKLLGANLEAVTNDQGIAHFGRQKNLQCTGLQIESPIATFDLHPHIPPKEQLVEKHSYQLKNKFHDEIAIDITPEEGKKHYRISINKIHQHREAKELQICMYTSSHRAVLQPVKHGISCFETGMEESILRIHIY